MCSISWKWSSSSQSNTLPLLSLYFNRDEQKARPQAKPPTLHQKKDTEFLAPVDPLRGGTWIAANEYGLVVAILNDYSVPPSPDKDYASRGHIVTSLATCKDLQEANRTLSNLLAEENYPAFSVLVFDTNKAGYALHQWNETKLQRIATESPFFTSSSWNSHAVQHQRQQTFVEDVITNNVPHEIFHSTTKPGEELSSVYMEREKTKTVSRTHVHVYPDNIVMEYFDRTDGQEYTSTLEFNVPALNYG